MSMGKGRPKGSANTPRARMLRLIDEQWPEFDPVARMIEQAELARADMAHRAEEYERFRDTGELPEVPAHEDNDGEGLEQVKAPHRILTGERNALSQMYERPARFLLPQLRAMEVKADMDLRGDITVVFTAE